MLSPLRNVAIGKGDLATRDLSKQINATTPVAGDGITIDYTPAGAVISTKDDINPDRMQWAMNYDFNASYYPGQVVRVVPGTVYIDQNGHTVPYSTSGSVPAIAAGCFVCVAYVPSGSVDSNYFNSYIGGQYPDGVSDNMINGVRWYEANIYYPQTPEPTAGMTASMTISGSSYTIPSASLYWQALFTIPTVKIQLCDPLTGIPACYMLYGFPCSGST